MITLTTWQLWQFMLSPLFALGVFWLVRNRKKLGSKWNITFRKARTVKVNLLTRSGRNIERYVVPDSRGIMHVENGSYPFLREASVTNGEDSIPEVWLSESQPYPAMPDIIELTQKIPVKVRQGDGTFLLQEREVPVHIVSFHNIKSAKLAGKTAEEIEQMLGSKIVNDIINATSKTMQKLDLMFFMICGILAITLIGFFMVYNGLKDIKSEIEILKVVINGTT